MGALVRTVAPAVEPVTLAEAKAHLRIDHTADDSLIAALITAARERIEDRTGRALINQTWRWELDRFPIRDHLLIPKAPLVSITEIRLVDEDAAESVFAASNYLVDASAEPGRIVLKDDKSWPTDSELAEARGARVTFVAGYGADGSSVPERLKLAVKMAVTTWYAQRENLAREELYRVPYGEDALLAEFMAWNAYGHASVDQEDAR